MGFLSNTASGAIGYGVHAMMSKKDKEREQDRIEEIRRMSLREYLDEYRNAHHIQLNTNDIDSFVMELEVIAHDYSIGV